MFHPPIKTVLSVIETFCRVCKRKERNSFIQYWCVRKKCEISNKLPYCVYPTRRSVSTRFAPSFRRVASRRLDVWLGVCGTRGNIFRHGLVECPQQLGMNNSKHTFTLARQTEQNGEWGNNKDEENWQTACGVGNIGCENTEINRNNYFSIYLMSSQ